MFSSHKRHPMRPCRVYNREIKHIHYLSIKPSGITSAFRHKCGKCGCSAFIKEYAIKHTIYNISHSTGQYHGHTYDITGLIPFLNNFHQIVNNQSYGNNTESCQKQFSKYFHAECHSVVFREINVEPIRNTNTFMPIHLGLYQNFYDLIDY